MTAMPEKNSVTYRNTLDLRIGRLTSSSPSTCIVPPSCLPRAGRAHIGVGAGRDYHRKS